MAEESTLEVGIRIDVTTGIAFFGVEDVNRQLAAGRRIREIRPGGAIMTEVGKDDGNVQLTLGGCDIVVVFEER